MNVKTPDVPYANRVQVCGRVSAAPLQRTLPSGDTMTTFRVIVDRPARTRRHSSVKVDTFDCVAWSMAIQRRVAALEAGDVVEVTGELRRRFHRTPGGAASMVDIEVGRCRRVRR